jgi:copper chaperone CopZ
MKMRFYSLSLTMLSFLVCGCSDTKTASTDKTDMEATAVAFNVAGAPTVMFEVSDMVCESCSAAVHETLAAQPGAKEVTVDLESKVVMVAVDEKTFDRDAAVAALLDKQFSHAKLVVAPEKPAEPAAPEEPASPEPSDG